MGTSNYLDDWGCLNIDGTVVTQCRNEDIPSGGYVEIPEGVTEIGEWVQDVRSIRDDREYELAYEMGIELPLSGEEFRGAFQQCTNLVSVSIPDSVTSISGGAFWLCTNLTSVTIPGSVRKLDAVCRGTLRTERYVGNNQMRWRSINADLCYETSGAFSGCTGLASVTLSEGLTLIGDKTFSGCTSLECITIPKGVRRIGNGAFEDCSRLASVALPKSIKLIGKEAFKGCKNLVIYYEGSEADWRNVGYDSAFEPGMRVRYNWQGPAPAGRTDLTSVVIPDGTTEILTGEYEGCKNLRSVTIPEGVRKIGESAFYGCSSLTSVTIPEGVTSIGESAFYKCKSLTSVTIPESVRSIGDEAFKGCPLEKVHYGGGKDGWNAIVGDRPMDKGITVHVHLHSKIQPGNAADRQAAQPGTAKLTMKCPSCEAEWQPGKSAGSMAACPFCGASLADKDEQPDTSAIQGVVRALILERGTELYKKESARQLKALLGDLAASFPRELKVLTIVVQEGVQERLLKADDDTDEEKREAAVWCKKYLTEYIGMADERAAEAVNILAAGLGWKPPL